MVHTGQPVDADQFAINLYDLTDTLWPPGVSALTVLPAGEAGDCFRHKGHGSGRVAGLFCRECRTRLVMFSVQAD